MKIGDCYKNMQKTNKAFYFYKKGLELDNKNPLLFMRFANLHLIQENYEKALLYYEKVSEMNDGKEENNEVKLGIIECKIHLEKNFEFYLE